MAIKINGQDMYRRVYNGQDVQKVILNGSQIRPTEIPHINYHVTSDFTGGGGGGGGGRLPGGWGGTNIVIEDDGVIAAPGEVGRVTYSESNGMPSLANARKIQVVINYALDDSAQIGLYDNVLETSLNNQGFYGLIGAGSQYYTQVLTLRGESTTNGRITNVSDGTYTSTLTIDLIDWTNKSTLSTTGPSGVSSTDSKATITKDATVTTIRSATSFYVKIYDHVILKSVDFYIWNYEPIPPAPDWIPTGYHLPSALDVDTLYSILEDWGVEEHFNEYLHIPPAGALSATTGEWIDAFSIIRASDFKNNVPGGFLMYNGQVAPNPGGMDASEGGNIRCFADTFVAPTSSWTTIYNAGGGAGIYWNQLDGIISIVPTGGQGYTIQDKNLGATVVWSQGDTLSQNNCGYYYQWGNCYGFPKSGATNTSSTQVDTTGYGDGTLYTSGVFIIGYSYWMNPRNQTLWS